MGIRYYNCNDEYAIKFLATPLRIVEEKLAEFDLVKYLENIIFASEKDFKGEGTLLNKFYKEHLNKDFAIQINKTSSNPNYIIVLNIAQCIKEELTDGEVCAVILHELGHIFNASIDTKAKQLNSALTIEDAPRIVLENVEISKTNNNNKEFYPDSFVKKMGYKDELIKSLNKNKGAFKNNQDFIDLRITQLNNIEILEGENKLFNL